MQSILTHAGIDVSAKTLEAMRLRGGDVTHETFGNDVAGHREMIKWLGKRARVCMEATGVYHLQLAIALRRAGVEVTVISPRAAKDYARSLMNRSKTDQVDAAVLLDYVQRMEFRPWEPPSDAALELKELGRRMKTLVHESVDEKNRLHAKTTSSMSKIVIADVKAHIKQIDARIAKMEREALVLIRRNDRLESLYENLIAGKGIGTRSAIQLLAELVVLDPSLTVRQVVAYAGLDPRVCQSGTSVHQPPRISKVGNARIREILYLVAMSSVRYDRGAKAFFSALIARGKTRMQAIVAVMRKLLHGIWICIQRNVPFDSSVLFAASLAKAETSVSAVAAHQPELEQSHPKGRSEAEERQLDSARAEARPQRRRKKVA